MGSPSPRPSELLLILINMLLTCWAGILLQVTINRRLLIGRDGPRGEVLVMTAKMKVSKFLSVRNLCQSGADPEFSKRGCPIKKQLGVTQTMIFLYSQLIMLI